MSENMRLELNRCFSCLLMALAVLFSCDKDGGQEQERYDGGMVLPIEDGELSPLGDNLVVAYTSDSPWTLTVSDGTWLEASPMKGDAGTTEIMISASPNLNSDRASTLRFSSGGDSKSFVLSQDRAVLEIEEESVTFGWRKGSSGFSVNSNVEWQLELECENDGHFSVVYEGVDTGGATGSRYVIIKANHNNLSDLPDCAKVRLRPVKRNNKGEIMDAFISLSEELDILQEFLIFLVDDSREAPVLEPFSELGADYVRGEGENGNAVGHVVSRILKVTSEADWEMNQDEFGDDWGLNVEVLSEETVVKAGRNASEKTLEITVTKPNPFLAERSARLRFNVTDDPTAERTVDIRQAPYIFSLGAGEDVVFGNSSGSAEVSLSTSGPWNIYESGLPSWLAVSPASGTGDAVISVSAPGQNLSFVDLRHVLTVNSGLNAISANQVIRQDRFLFELEYPEIFDAPMSRLDLNAYTVYVTSSGPWTLDVASGSGDDGSGWLDVTGVSGEQCVREPVTVRATSVNPFRDNVREKRIVLASTLHRGEDGGYPSGAWKQMNFTQDIFRFDMIRDGNAFDNVGFAAYSTDPDSVDFRLRCSAPWRVESKPEWLTLDLTSGTGDTYPLVTMTAADNIYDSWNTVREGEVTIACDLSSDGSYSERKSFSVTQDSFVFGLSSSSAYNVGALNESAFDISVECTSGAAWRMAASSDASWIGIDTENHMGSGQVSFRPAQNGTLSLRTGTVVISSLVSGNIPDLSFTVSQDAYRFDGTALSFPEFSEINPGSETFMLDCMGPWSVASVPAWLTVSPQNGSGNTAVRLTPSKNLGAERTGNFTVNSTVGGVSHSKTINVSQRNYVFEEVSGFGTLEAGILEGASRDLKFICSGSWTASAIGSGVMIDRESGTGGRDNEENLHVGVSANYSLSSRTLSVIVRSSDDASKEARLSVLQPAYEFSLGSLTPFGHDGGRQEVSVNCTGEVSATASAPWVSSVSVSQGKLIVEVEKNTSDSPRTAVINVDSEHKQYNPLLSGTLTVSQSAEDKKETR